MATSATCSLSFPVKRRPLFLRAAQSGPAGAYTSGGVFSSLSALSQLSSLYLFFACWDPARERETALVGTLWGREAPFTCSKRWKHLAPLMVPN